MDSFQRLTTRRWRVRSCVLFVFLACLNAYQAQATACFAWSVNGSTAMDPSAYASQVCQYDIGSFGGAGNAQCTPGAGDCGGTPTGAGQGCHTSEAYHVNSSGATGDTQAAMTSISITCPVNPCSALAGTSKSGLMSGGQKAVGTAVVDSQGCKGVVSNVYGGSLVTAAGVIQAVTYDGTQDTATPPAGTPVRSGVNCVASGGATSCLEPQKTTGCGTVNGDEVCLSTPPKGGCINYASGGVACLSSASDGSVTTPPVPSSPTSASTPATPSATITTTNSDGSVTTVYYYNQGVVGGSLSAVGSQSGGANVGNGGSGLGSAPGSSGPSAACAQGTRPDGNGSCVGDSLSGGQACDAPPVCAGDPVQCDVDYQSWRTRCSNDTESDLATAIGDVPAPSSGAVDLSTVLHETGAAPTGDGACPAAPVITVDGRTFTLSMFDKLCEFAGTISFVVLACGYFVAARVMFSNGGL